MKFVQFKINGYRAIDNTKISVSQSLRPIIGINESGKTTILQAILAFDKTSDLYNGGLHLSYTNRYKSGGEKQATVTAKILIESKEELEEISEELGLTMGDKIIKQLNEKFEKQEPIELTRVFSKKTKKYRVDNIETKNISTNTKLANKLYRVLPYILYFDDFSDRVPEKIKFKLDQDNVGKYTTDKIKRSEEWHKLIEEMFKRKGYSLEEYIQTTDENDKDGIISDVEDLLNEDIINDWKELISKYGEGLGEESSNLKLNLEIKEDGDNLIFEFKIKDRTSGANARFFNITERSKGFQWFFNFITKLKYNHKYIEDNTGAIYLLDEPGSYLHTSAQEELLKKLYDISQRNTILYCTHSQFLLNTEVVNVGNIIVAQKEDGNINAILLKETKLSEDRGALAPLYQALRLQIPYLENNSNYQIITEGIIEYYLLKLVQKHTSKIDKDIIFIPGAGVTQLSSLVSYAITFSKGYRVLMDSDRESRGAYDKYKEQFGDEEIKKFFKYILPSKKENVQFENYISAGDIKKIIDKTGIQNIKSAIAALYYCENSVQVEIIKNLSKKTLKRLDILIGVIQNVKK